MPGTDVSKGSGPGVPATGGGSWRSVRMNPSRSSLTLSDSQPVAGSAPMKQKRPVQAIACALEAAQVLDRQPAVARSRGDDHRTGRDLASVAERDGVKPHLRMQAHHLGRSVQPSSESHRLNGGSRSEIATGDAVRKTHE